jgi:diguanylate cyclase
MKFTLLLFIAFLAAATVVFSQASWEHQHFFGNTGEIAALILATWNCFSLAGSYRQNDPPRKAWTILGFGAFVWLLAQILTMYHELILQAVAHGTIADAFWMIGYVLLLRGLIMLVKDFRSTGLPLGTTRSYILQAGVLGMVLLVLFWTLLLPVIQAPERSPVLNVLDIGYPVLDFLLILLCSILIRFSWILRGSGISRSWVFLCAGFITVAGADIGLAYSSNVNSFLYRILDVVYFSSYFLFALAAANQLRVQQKLLKT